ncbi:unnamed protein product [Dicrocoelium dendriticum]|nr:unnamed protein product [Dicrocoelium dendriticum]
MIHSFAVHDDPKVLETPRLPSPIRPNSYLYPTSNGAARLGKQKAWRKSAPLYSTNGTAGGTGENRFDARFKILMLGNSGVGKTSILRTLMGEPFNPGTISTIGIDLAKKIFIVEGNRIQLEIWDTAGQEQYYSIVALHFREAKAFIVVYDVTDLRTFEQIRKYWLRSVDEHMDEPVPVFFAANKVDLTSQRVVTAEEGEQLALQQCAHGHFETSAKSGQNINELFQRVADSMVATWGAPRRWYEVTENGEVGTHWPNQMPVRQTVQLSYPIEQPPKSRCCQLK